jgi:hypothetical protein
MQHGIDAPEVGERAFVARARPVRNGTRRTDRIRSDAK